MVPKGWVRRSLGEVLEVKHGFAFQSEFFSSSRTPFKLLTPGNFAEEGGFRDTGAKQRYYSGPVPEDYILQHGDLLVAMTEQAPGLLGSSLLVPEGRTFLHNQRLGRVLIIRPDLANKDYLYHLFNSSPVRKRIAKTAAGTKVRHTSPDRIKAVVCALPPKEEQVRLAQVLSTADQAIAAATALLAAKQILFKALMQQLLTGKRRLTGFRKPWKKALLSDLVADAQRPVTWREETLYRLASVRRWSGGVFEREALFGHQIKVKKLKTIKEGDLLISHIQSAYGAMALVPREFDGMQVSDLYTVLVPRDPATLDIRFLGYLSQRKRMWHQAYLASNGFFAERLRLNFDPVEFLSHAILVPPEIGEQQQIVQILDTSTREIDLLQRHLDLLKLQKRGLMQRLLTGQVRVKEKGATHG